MNAGEKRTALRRATLQTLIAIAASGGAFYDAIGVGFGPMGDLHVKDHVRDWQASIVAAVCGTYPEACARKAFAIEANDAGGTKILGWRLIRLGGGEGGGHLYHGENFRTLDDLWSAMRTIADLREHPACKIDPPEAAPAPRSIVVIGRRHFTGGNTYHTAEIMIDGESVHRTARAPGYGSDYETSAAEWLESKGLVSRKRYAASGGVQTLARACEDRGITYAATGVDVARKKDLT